MKRQFKKGDAVKIGKFGPLSSMSKYEGLCGRIAKSRKEKVMGFWSYDVQIKGSPEVIATCELFLERINEE